MYALALQRNLAEYPVQRYQRLRKELNEKSKQLEDVQPQLAKAVETEKVNEDLLWKNEALENTLETN